MLSPFIQRPGRSGERRSRERGVTLLLVAVSIFSVIAMAALSIDISTLYQANAEAQRAADAAALTAARVISFEGITGDPTNTTTWQKICGGANSPASLAAIGVANQNLIGGAVPSTVYVYYGTNVSVGTEKDCSNLSGSAGFGVNPVVKVYVQQAKLPSFFARVFSLLGNGAASNSGVSATATAEAFNPSNAGSYAVQPRCVKPWIVPNYNPLYPTTTCGTGCSAFVNTTSSGQIVNPGLVANNGVIGEQFWLIPYCNVDPGQKQACSYLGFRSSKPQANFGGDSTSPLGPPTYHNLEYLPGQVPATFTAIPTSKSGACVDVTSSTPYAEAIAGCDQSTKYQCGSISSQSVVDVSENPGNGDTGNGVQCLTHQGTSGGTGSLAVSGQDTLDPFLTNTNSLPTYPFQIQAGTDNPLVNSGVSSGTVITSSTSIVSLPIYDQTVTSAINPTGTTNVSIVGFLQVFINAVDKYGNVYVTVMNVTGCASNPGTNYAGTSPVPVRLITSP